MRAMVAAAMVLTVAGQAAAIECPITHAIYEQPGGKVGLRFQPVPHDAAVNQIAAFRVTLPGSTVLKGSIYIPNGFGQPHGDIRVDAADLSGEPLWEGVVYALIDGAITEYPWDPETVGEDPVSPQQILLPVFGAHVWYSMLRQTAFAEDGMVYDTFTLAACAK